jgi:hypothetical protein
VYSGKDSEKIFDCNRVYVSTGENSDASNGTYTTEPSVLCAGKRILSLAPQPSSISTSDQATSPRANVAISTDCHPLINLSIGSVPHSSPPTSRLLPSNSSGNQIFAQSTVPILDPVLPLGVRFEPPLASYDVLPQSASCQSTFRDVLDIKADTYSDLPFQSSAISSISTTPSAKDVAAKSNPFIPIHGHIQSNHEEYPNLPTFRYQAGHVGNFSNESGRSYHMDDAIPHDHICLSQQISDIGYIKSLHAYSAGTVHPSSVYIPKSISQIQKSPSPEKWTLTLENEIQFLIQQNVFSLESVDPKH